MFGQMHNNLRDAVQKSFNKPPMPKSKGLPKGVKLPYPFNPFTNIPGAKARQVNALTKEGVKLPYPFNALSNIPGAKSAVTAARPKAPPKPTAKRTSLAAGATAPPKAQPVDLMKGKWVKKGLGRRWQPDGLSRPMTPFEEHQWAVQKNMDSHKGKPKKEPEYVKNTWQPEGDMIGFY